MHQFIYKEMVHKSIKRGILIVCATVFVALLSVGAYRVICAL